MDGDAMSGMHPAGEDSASVLFVDGGNVTASPAAELLLRQSLSLPGVAVSSAGTYVPTPEPVPVVAGELLVRRGVDPSGHRARQLTAAMLEEADLVVTMTALQRRHVALMHPPGLNRTWTLLSLVASLAAAPPARESEPRGLRNLSARAAAGRSATDDDVDEAPAGRRRGTARMLDVVASATEVLAEGVRSELVGDRLPAPSRDDGVDEVPAVVDLRDRLGLQPGGRTRH